MSFFLNEKRKPRQMKENFRKRLLQGELLVGTLITYFSHESAEILATAGFDWLFIDMEHSPLGTAEAQAILQIAGEKADCILRVPLNDEIWIKKALDTGAAGILVPQVNTVEEAQRVVRFSKYPPQGARSIGAARAHAFGMKMNEYYQRANNDTAVVIQAEHINAVKNIESIVAVEGIDAVLVGPFDLSSSMGLMGQVDHPDVLAALEQVKQACQKANMPLGIFATSAERAKTYADSGYRLVAVSSDTILLSQAARSILKVMRV
jgi:2-dehydro-3-deoxyglucarate aldolase